jgi:ABC-2 type transport system permease protein
MKDRRELSAREASCLLCDGSIWPVHGPCALPEDDWVAWNEEVREAGRAAVEESIAAARRTVRSVLAAASAAVRERLRARADLFGTAAFLAVILFIFHRLWTVVAGEGGQAGGYTVSQLVTYLLVTEIVTMSPGQAHARIGEDVRSGAFTVALLRPLSYAQWEMARAAGEAAARAVALLGTGLLVLAAMGALPALDPRGVALGLGLLVPAAILVELSARVGVGLLAFWVEDSTPFYWIWQKLSFVLGGLFLPLELYPGWLRSVAECLPFRALLHGPARTVVAFEPTQARGDVLALALWAGVFATALAGVEALGRRRVQANGG